MAPPAELAETVTFEKLYETASAAGVTGALIVQPINHKYDHSYTDLALKTYPNFFRGMGLIDPSLSPEDAVSVVNTLHSRGYVGVRFNAGAFSEYGGVASPTGRAVYSRCGELGMVVGLMAFGGLPPHLGAVRVLLSSSPKTKLVVDHFGFFRQPATGGLLGDSASNDEDAWKEIVGLSAYPQVYIKVSALFRTSAEAPPFSDLASRVADLLAAYGADRLLWGSDFPFCTTGGQSVTSVAQTYEQAVAVPTFWRAEGLDEAALGMLMGGNAARLFGFGRCVDAVQAV
mgnify:CR=1 FL=1